MATTKAMEDAILRKAMERMQNEAVGGGGQTVAPETPEPKIEKETAARVKAPAPPLPQKPAAKPAPAAKAKPAKPAKAARPVKAKAIPAAPAPKGFHNITYTPRHDGDPVFTNFFGMRFTANVPRQTNNPELINLAMTNPWFQVDGREGPDPAETPEVPENDIALRAGGAQMMDGKDPEKAEIEATEEILEDVD